MPYVFAAPFKVLQVLLGIFEYLDQKQPDLFQCQRLLVFANISLTHLRMNLEV